MQQLAVGAHLMHRQSTGWNFGSTNQELGLLRFDHIRSTDHYARPTLATRLM